MAASINSFGQTKLKNGVYEFTSPRNPIPFMMEEIMDRIIIVKDSTVLYNISNRKYFMSEFGVYCSKLETYSDSLYKFKSENIELNITISDSNSIDVEVVTGRIRQIYSGGQYWDKIVPLQPERQTLTFVRELTAEDVEQLENKEKIKSQ
jgi:hypothetical protein